MRIFCNSDGFIVLSLRFLSIIIVFYCLFVATLQLIVAQAQQLTNSLIGLVIIQYLFTLIHRFR